ncbi:MAG: MFS transporter [Acetobacteraceae bacterium]
MPPLAHDEIRRFWPVILACFCMAVFAWGFGFYGQSVYLAELRRLHGWSSANITSATTGMYLGGAILMPFIHGAMRRYDARAVLVGGTLLLGVGACGFARATAVWHLYAAAMAMAAGWAATTGTAIATVLSFWFDHRRGLAISLALNGASASGFIVAPALVNLSQAIGLRTAVPIAVVTGWCVLVPLLLFCISRQPSRLTAAVATDAAADPRPAFDQKADVLRDARFWSVAAPFALALAAQVGFIIHMVAFLIPTLGPAGTGFAVSLASLAAMLGRIALGLVIDRLHQRATSAISFASQAVGLALMLLWPGQPWAMYGGCLLFGASVGNVITLPAILIQREFAARSFGLLIGLSGATGQFTLALGPALFGVLRDLAGSYGPVLGLCIGLQLTAAALVLRRV